MEKEEMTARLLARDIAELAQNELKDKLIASKIEDSKGLMQAETCQLLASFFLCTSIKILQLNELSENAINDMCNLCIHMAHKFTEIANFRIEKGKYGNEKKGH